MAMGKDVTAFRERFNAYKNGKSVSEIYDAGLPRYAGGKDPNEDVADFLRQHEGYRDKVYLDGNGIPTIGYGFTDAKFVNKGTINRTEADAELKRQIKTRQSTLRDILGADKWDSLTNDSKKALTSYHYNYPAGFKSNTKFMKAWRAGNYAEAIRQVDAGMNDPKNPGLRTRRLAEQALLKADPFLTGIHEVPIQPIVAQPVSTAIRPIIPAQQTVPAYDTLISPYVSGKPMIHLMPTVNMPDLILMIEDSQWQPTFADGKLPGYADGKIHIKPENRGKFTALKKRTGHSASWFKENGTPAQKKMAVFALNAKKWHHADGKLPEYGNGKEGNKAKTLINALLHPFLFLRDRMYSTVPPSGYETDRVVNFITGEKKREYSDPNTEAAYGLYTKQDSINTLGYGPFFRQNNIPYRVVGENQHGDPILRVAVKDIMKPSLSLSGAYEFIYPNLPGQYPIAPKGKVGNSAWLHGHALGGYTKGTSKDENGVYDYYSDTWDINPFKGQSAVDDGSDLFKVGNKIGLGYFDDIIPWGNPVKIYGKVYQK